MADPKRNVRVFVSYASADEHFVRRLVADLKSRRLDVWFDEHELQPGDSIVQGISDGLSASDYLVVVLSRASASSRWVQAELNAALFEQLSNRATVVLPVLIEDSAIPPLLRDRVYADFRTDYEAGLAALFRVLEQERLTADALATPPRPRSFGLYPPTCREALAALRLADLRRRITARLARHELAVIWYDTLESRMDDDMMNRTKVECVIELLERARDRKALDDLIANLCAERADLALSG